MPSTIRLQKEKETSRVAPSYEKNLTNLKLLFSMRDVKSKIVKLRKDLKIPTGGFDLKNDAEKLKHWNDDLDWQSRELRDSARFRHHRKNTKKKVLEGMLDKNMAEKQLDLLYQARIPRKSTIACRGSDHRRVWLTP